MVDGRNAAAPAAWLAARPDEWLKRIRWGCLDLLGTYRSVFDTVLPDVVRVADPFHVVKLANQRLELVASAIGGAKVREQVVGGLRQLLLVQEAT